MLCGSADSFILYEYRFPRSPMRARLFLFAKIAFPVARDVSARVIDLFLNPFSFPRT